MMYFIASEMLQWLLGLVKDTLKSFKKSYFLNVFSFLGINALMRRLITS